MRTLTQLTIALCLASFLPAAPAAAPATQPAEVDCAPSRVTLQLKDAAPRAVFEAIAAEGKCAFTPNPSDLWSRAADPVSLDVEGEPFWAAMKSACAKTGIYPTLVDRRKLTLTSGNKGWMDGPTLESNGFLVLGVQAVRVNTIRLGTPDQKRRELSIQLVALPEPKLRVLRAARGAALDEAVDDRGQSLLISASPAPFAVTGGPFAWNLELRLQAPADAGQRIARIKGSAKFALQSAADVWTIDDVLKASNVSRTVGRHTLTVTEVARNPADASQHIVRVTVAGRGRELDAIQALMHPGCLDLLDEMGTQLIFRGWTRAVDKPQVEYAYHFASPPNGASPARLVWEIPSAMREVAVPFEFTDLPMP